MSEHNRLSTATPTRPGAGTWVALALFGLISWWGLWGAAVEHTQVPNGFDWFFCAALAGIAVSRWLARYGAQQLTPGSTPGNGRLGSGSALYIGATLLLPGSACWLALRNMPARRREQPDGRPSPPRFARAALWALWALAGTTGQITMIWALMTNSPSTDVTPDIILGAASLLNAASITVLMCVEPTVHTSARRTPAISS